MSRKYATPLLLEIRQSRMMTVWLVLTHGLALLMLPVTGAPVLLSVIVTLAILFCLRRAYRLHARRSHPAACRRLVWKAGDECLITWRSGQQQVAKLQQRAFVMPWLVVLQLKFSGGKSYSLALLPDMLDPEVLRRLRVRLMLDLQHCGTQAA
ncbi:MAG: protein YgfX [Gammaproteobacteria bacterium]